MAAAVAGLAAVAVLLLPGPAWARDEPPAVQGLSVADAQTALLAWDKSVKISYAPDPQQLPDGVDRSTVVVLRSDWLNPTPIDPEPPQIRLSLGAQVPDLTGLTLDAATAALASRGLVASPTGQSPTDWVVGIQRPAQGTLLEFQAGVLLFMAAPGSLTQSPNPVYPDGSSIPWWVFVAAGVGLLVLAAVATLVLRRAVRRRKPPAPPERVEVRGSPGAVQGPEVTENQPGASLSVRVEPHYDPGTLTMQEVPR